MGSLSRHPHLALLCFSFIWLALTRALTYHPCYFNVNQIASDKLMPCYSDTKTQSNHYSCCRQGDFCLEQNACWDVDTGVTYQYGCTDPDFKDPHCPKKCHFDTGKSQWVGLVFCNGTNGNNVPNNTWICHHPKNCNDRNCTDSVWNEEIQKIPHSECGDLQHGDEFVALAPYPSVIPTISQLPNITNKTGTDAFWANYTDRWKDLAPGGRQPGSNNAGHTSSNKPATTIGIAVGLGVGIPLLLGVAATIFFYLRHQRKKTANELTATATATADSTKPDQPAPGYPDDKKDAAASHGFKAELDGTPSVNSPGPSEMQDTSVMGSPYGSPLVSPATIHEGFEGSEISKFQGGRQSQAHEMAG